jgi:uncharacterized RDD family membrane protein YckC
MLSPRCPCGYETRAGFRPLKPARSEEPPITVEFRDEAVDADAAKWRSQLDKKFDVSRPNFPDMREIESRIDGLLGRDQGGDDRAEPRRSLAVDQGEVTETLADQVFGRRQPKPRSPAPAPAVPPPSGPFAESQDESSAADAAFDPLPRPAVFRATSSEQKSLSLEPLTADIVRRKPATPAEGSDEAGPIPREILFSRVLAGILDLLLPVAVAMLFVFAGSWVTGSDFFSMHSTRVWAVLAGGLYFVNGVYFFWSAGQTPGMHLTELKLVGADGRAPEFGGVLIRVLLFLPVLATVVGLILALFDPECRAVHDRLSGTKVVPLSS